MTAWTYARLPDPLENSDCGGTSDTQGTSGQALIILMTGSTPAGRPKWNRADMKKIRKNACKKLVRIGREMQGHPE